MMLSHGESLKSFLNNYQMLIVQNWIGSNKSDVSWQSITHRRMTPVWPQANSEADNITHKSCSWWKARCGGKHINKFLFNYRMTPHSTTGFAPAELLFKLPQLPSGRTQRPSRTASVIMNRMCYRLVKYRFQSRAIFVTCLCKTISLKVL